MPETCSPAANYLTRSNIIHPLADLFTLRANAEIAAQEAAARAELQDRTGVAHTGGKIDKGR